MTKSGEESTYYEQWGPIQRRLRFAWNTLRGATASPLVILAESKWRLGDEIMAIPVYQALSERLRDTKRNVRVVALCSYPELLEGNPHVDGVNESGVRPHVYLKLRDVPRDANRGFYYQHHFNLGDTLALPKLYFEDWSTPLWDDVPKGEGAVIALCRGASWTTKRWPEEHWTSLGRELESRGYRVIVLGQEGEEIAVGTSFVGRSGVGDAARLLHHAAMAISNDSGLMHLSLAAGTPVIGLFGPTDPGILIQDNPDFYPVTNERECQGCWNRNLAIETPGHCPKQIAVCMETISVERVLDQVGQIVSAGRD